MVKNPVSQEFDSGRYTLRCSAIRGGSWTALPVCNCVADRNYENYNNNNYFLGFRLACDK